MLQFHVEMHFFSFSFFFFFFFNDTATTELYTLSLHDALPIAPGKEKEAIAAVRKYLANETVSNDFDAENFDYQTGVDAPGLRAQLDLAETVEDRKSTRLNSSHGYISYAVFCLKKKKDRKKITEDLDNNRRIEAHKYKDRTELNTRA